jgi:site-specific recombinase
MSHGLHGHVYFIIVKVFPFCVDRIRGYARQWVWIGSVEQILTNDEGLEKWAIRVDRPTVAEYWMSRDSVIVAFWKDRP